MKKGIGKLFRSPALLVIAVVVMMAAATLAYAHWSGTAPIHGDVQTGNIGAGWWNAATNDDGWISGDWDEGDGGGPLDWFDNYPPYECWDEAGNPMDCEDSSADPLEPGLDPGRYDKDVARCAAEAQGDNLYFWVENGYPSYHCTVAGNMVGMGSVPVMTDGMALADEAEYYRQECQWFYGEELWEGPTASYWDDEGNYLFEFADFLSEDGSGSPEDPHPDGMYQEGEWELWMSCQEFPLFVTDMGDYYEVTDDVGRTVLTFGPWVGSCGTQVDPFYGDWEFESPQDALYTFWVHVENGAAPNANYHLGMKAKFINWNEWDEFHTCTEIHED